jgi:hypothetical protein
MKVKQRKLTNSASSTSSASIGIMSRQNKWDGINPSTIENDIEHRDTEANLIKRIMHIEGDAVEKIHRRYNLISRSQNQE